MLVDEWSTYWQAQNLSFWNCVSPWAIGECMHGSVIGKRFLD